MNTLAKTLSLILPCLYQYKYIRFSSTLVIISNINVLKASFKGLESSFS